MDFAQAVLTILALAVPATLFLGLATLGLWFAANHTWIEDGTVKGLILYPVNKRLIRILVRLDSRISITRLNATMSIAQAIKNILIVIFVFWLARHCIILAFLQDANYISGLWVVLAFLFWNKPFKDIGAMVFACYRCMPNFWFGIPISLLGIYLGLTKDPLYFNLIGGSALLVSGISAWSTLLKTLYDSWKEPKQILNPPRISMHPLGKSSE